MEIHKIEIEHMQKGGFNAIHVYSKQHIKTLPYLSVVQATEGSYDIQLGDAATQNTGNNGFFIAPSDVQQTIVHNMDSLSKTMTARWVFLSVKLNGAYTFDHLYDFPTIVPSDQKSKMNKWFDRLFSTDDVFDEYICYYEIVRLLFQIATKKAYENPTHAKTALAFIKDHYKEKITVQEIAQAATLSTSHLFPVFKKEIGVSPIAYLNNYRLSIAAELLLQTDKTMVQIAEDVGIDDPIYFNKLFKKAYYMSPTRYRTTFQQSQKAK